LGLRAYKELWLTFFFFLVPLPRKNLGRQIVVIVGSSRGLGRELCYKLGSLESTVVCIDIQSSEQEITSKQVNEAGGRAFYYQCDITSKDQVDKTVGTIVRERGEINMLYHCCSLPSPRTVVNNPPTVKQTIDVSVTSYFYLLESILPHMKSNGKGHIVFLTSVAAINGVSQQLALSVSQFAIQGLYESLVEELRVAKQNKAIKTTLVHIYPFIVSENLENDIRLRVPGFFGSIRADEAADAILDGVRKNKAEISIPKYCLFISHVLKIFPRRVMHLLRDFLDTGIDF